MKVSVIYSGAMRSFDKCLPNQVWHVLRHFPNARFYVAAAFDEDARKAGLLADRYGRENVRSVTQTQPEMVIPQGCPPTWNGPRSHYMHEPYAISVSPQAVLGQLWMLREGWRLYEAANDPADLIIRIRPDLWFHRFETPYMFSRNCLHYPEHPISAFTPFFGRFGGVNDRFALMGNEAAKAYFTAYDSVSEMIAEGAPLHPETLIKHAMVRKGCAVSDDMMAEFSTLRTNGEMRPPEILASDIAHYAKSN